MYKYVVLSKVNQNAIQKIKINEVSIFIIKSQRHPKCLEIFLIEIEQQTKSSQYVCVRELRGMN